MSMPPPLISVVVPSFNQAQFIGATLQSLIDQRDPALEILVVDGGSTDGSVQVIRSFERHLAWWVSESDQGQSHALNKGFARAQGDWLAWLNSDDVLLPGALSVLREHVAREPGLQWWIGGGHFLDAHGRRKTSFQPPRGLETPMQLADWRTFWFAQPSTFFSAALFRKVGGAVREDLHYAMDLELWLRLLVRAAPGIIPEAVSGYRIHEDAKTGMLTVPAELEIIAVIENALGRKALDARIRCIAADRLHFEQQFRRLERWAAPVAGPYRIMKSAIGRLHRQTGGKGRRWPP
jgi:glycosyltransferase involved in cell wall biosynthesis